MFSYSIRAAESLHESTDEMGVSSVLRFSTCYAAVAHIPGDTSQTGTLQSLCLRLVDAAVCKHDVTSISKFYLFSFYVVDRLEIVSLIKLILRIRNCVESSNIGVKTVAFFFFLRIPSQTKQGLRFV